MNPEIAGRTPDKMRKYLKAFAALIGLIVVFLPVRTISGLRDWKLVLPWGAVTAVVFFSLVIAAYAADKTDPVRHPRLKKFTTFLTSEDDD